MRPEARVFAKVSRYAGLGFVLPVSTFVGYVIGYLLDKLFGTAFLYLVFLALGTIGGFLALFREIQRLSKEDGT